MEGEGLTSSSEDEATSAASKIDDVALSSNTNQTHRVCNNRDLNDKIIKLERENFQLKLRIHLNETKGSVVEPRCLNVYPKNTRDPALEEEISILKHAKQKLEYQLQEAESKLEAEFKIKENLLKKEAAVLNKFTELRHYANALERKVVQLQRQGSSQLYSPDGKPPILRSHPISALCASPNGQEPFKSFETSTPIPTRLLTEFQTAPPPPMSPNWFAQYEHNLQKLSDLQSEYDRIKRDFELLLEERNGLVAQLSAVEKSYQSYQSDTEMKYGTMIDRLTKENQKLEMLNRELELSLRQAQGRTVALSNAAKLEMSNQLKIHQSALEKVHREQAILISELQALKKIGELEKYTRPAGSVPVSARTLIPQKAGVVVAALKAKESCLANFGDGDDEETGICQVEAPSEEQLRRVRSSEDKLEGLRYENNIELMNKQLREKNSKLAIKLQQTRNSLKKAIELLEHSEKDKEGMEKVICRQLHRTHKILYEVKETLSVSKSNEDSKEPTLPATLTNNNGKVGDTSKFC